jgi:hypothetical protein
MHAFQYDMLHRQTNRAIHHNTYIHTYISHLIQHLPRRHSSQIVPDGFIGEVVHYNEILHHHFTSVIHATATAAGGWTIIVFVEYRVAQDGSNLLSWHVMSCGDVVESDRNDDVVTLYQRRNIHDMHVYSGCKI